MAGCHYLTPVCDQTNVRVSQLSFLMGYMVALKRAVWDDIDPGMTLVVYLVLVYLVTALVPSDTACLANSPGRSRRTAVWISRLVIVDRLL